MNNLREPILVIGAQGMLGTDLMKALHKKGLKAVGIDCQDIDIRDGISVAHVLPDRQPATVINAAAATNVDGCESTPEEAFAVNARGPGLIAQACSRTGAFLLHISTDYVFDGTKGSPYEEDHPLSPLGVYGRSKAEGERAVQETLPNNHCIVRTQWLYGINGKNFVETMLDLARSRTELTVVNDQYGCPTYTRDLAAGLLDALEAGAEGLLHITNDGITTWHGFARAIFDLAGVDHVQVHPQSTAELQRPAPRPLYSALDTSRFAQLTGKPLRPWRDALADYLKERAELSQATS